MKFAIISDIHANLQAWLAVSADMGTLPIDRVIHLGDLIGYGPNPREVMSLAYHRIDYNLMGNHDAAVLNKLNLDKWNRRARQMIRWTRNQLTEEQLKQLSKAPLSLSNRQFRCTHSECSRPGEFYYVQEAKHALHSWRAVSEQLIFIGHTHIPKIFVLGSSGEPHELEAQSFMCEEGKRYIVNVGSVGFPRNESDHASYVYFDDEEMTVYWRRVPFDVSGYQTALDSMEPEIQNLASELPVLDGGMSDDEKEPQP